MASAQKKVAFQIISFLNASLADGSIKEDDKEGIEVASQCISEAFGVDLDKAEDKAAYSIEPESLVSLLQKVQAAPAAAPVAEKKAATAEDKAGAEKAKSTGNQLMAKKDYQGAIKAYGDAIELDGENAVYWSNRAAAHSQLQNHSSAISDARQALVVDPNFSKAYSRLGHALFSSGEYADAVEAYEKGLELDPNNATMKSSLATAKSRVPAASNEDDASPSEDADADSVATNSRGAGAGAGAGAGGFPGFPGMGAGGMPDMAAMMNNPAIMNMAQQMMANGGLEQLMNNPMLQRMMGGGGMPDMNELMSDPTMRRMAEQFRGAGGAGSGADSMFSSYLKKMVKISEKIAQAQRDGRPWWSFEFFPPKTADGWVNLYDRIERMKLLGPVFVDITWGAGGATSEATTAFVKTAHAELGLETCMHLTCTNMPVEMIDTALKEAYDSGCRNILALRGDPPRGTEEWKATEGGFNHAVDLVRHIRKKYGDYFDIGIAGFPEGHPGSTSPEEEMRHFKIKVDAGANIIFTQMFYDADVFIDWARRVRAAGITIPIAPGIMPIQTFAAFKRRTDFSKTIVPQKLWDMLEPIKDDDKAVRELGTKFVADMCKKIMEANLGIDGLHIYTMNLSRGTEMLLEEMNFVATSDIVKPLPWRLSLTSKRRAETTRPIFWSNRQRSYISRTQDWDEFPNGRWGDQSSPAFGDLDGLALALPHSPSDAEKIWGLPQTIEDIQTLFAKFCQGQLSALPWSDQPLASETTVISGPLAQLNLDGFLTINSQPRVDGASSTDERHGWGPRNGYVYQKAYLEFFAPPDKVSKLLELVAQTAPSATYHAVTKKGELRTNTPEGPNAVTWGVFPGAEVIQPTVVDSQAFLAWKDEAFELGNQWAMLYEKSSPKSAELIRNICDTYYLVNIVYNDFRDSDELAIFRPFATLTKGSPTLEQKPLGNGN
ncbi:hypothetical protein MNV49_001608 [Pseudohyphozyma bogoriensis]|nr:hypothetical protein MNV49_001608 [Pseudohyphozyma bogoriensis]